MHPVHRYARDVVRGHEPAGPSVRDSCKRHLADLKRKDVAFATELADRVLDFFPDVLKHYTAHFAGLPFELHPSQTFIVGSIFGWVRKEHRVRADNCLRRFRRAYIEEGKGSGKTPLAGGIILYAAFSEGEPDAQCFIAAASKDQSMICFRDVDAMCQQSPHLSKRASFTGGKVHHEIYIPSTMGFIRPLSRTAGRSGSGKRPYIVVCDELHEHPDDTVLQTLEEGFKFREEPLLVMITNSGLDDESSVCFIEHENAVKVASGDLTDDALFSYVCGLDEGDDPLDIDQDQKDLYRIYKKANPTLGTVVQFDELRDRAKAAKRLIGRRNSILRWHFCTWTGAVEAAFAKEMWMAIEDPTLTFDEFIGKRCWAGADLSRTKDLTAIAYVAEDYVDEEGLQHYIAFVDSYTPADTLEERSRRDGASYPEWVRQGYLTATPGGKIKYRDVAPDLVERSMLVDFQSCAYDQYAWSQFEDALLAIDGGDLIECVNHPQGTTRRANTPLWMPGSIEALETLIYENRIRVHVNPVVRMAVSTSQFYETENGNRRYIKGRPNARIDAIVALTQAVGAAIAGIEADPPSPFDDPDFDLIEYMK